VGRKEEEIRIMNIISLIGGTIYGDVYTRITVQILLNKRGDPPNNYSEKEYILAYKQFKSLREAIQYVKGNFQVRKTNLPWKSAYKRTNFQIINEK
jgi:hypothetical protein